MSSSTKKKHVINQIMDDDCTINEDQQLVKVLGARGNHLYEIRTVSGETFLVSMPTKFRNTVFIKPGSFVIIESIKEGNKVKGEIVKILLKHHVKQMKKDGIWLNEFEEEDAPVLKQAEEADFDSNSDSENEDI